eukprot:356111-Chlamydomonas_euryale.AAC.5
MENDRIDRRRRWQIRVERLLPADAAGHGRGDARKNGRGTADSQARFGYQVESSCAAMKGLRRGRRACSRARDSRAVQLAAADTRRHHCTT